LAHSSFRDIPFFEEGKCSCASFWGRLSGTQAIAKTSRLPPYRAGEGIRKEYATIDCNESERSQPIATIVTIAIAPIIVAQDAHKETSDMRRPQRYNQL
jgi:hypothetical protein